MLELREREMRPETEKVGCECQKESHGRVDGGHSAGPVANRPVDLSPRHHAICLLPLPLSRPCRRGVAWRVPIDTPFPFLHSANPFLKLPPLACPRLAGTGTRMLSINTSRDVLGQARFIQCSHPFQVSRA